MKIDYWLEYYQSIANDNWYKPIPFIYENNKFISFANNFKTEKLIKSTIDTGKTIKEMNEVIKVFLETQLLNNYPLEKLKISIYYRVFANKELLKILNEKNKNYYITNTKFSYKKYKIDDLVNYLLPNIALMRYELKNISLKNEYCPIFYSAEKVINLQEFLDYFNSFILCLYLDSNLRKDITLESILTKTKQDYVLDFPKTLKRTK